MSADSAAAEAKRAAIMAKIAAKKAGKSAAEAPAPKEAPAATAQPAPFAVGGCVMVHGLVEAPQHNGALGFVEGALLDGRHEIKLGEGSGGISLKIKPANLRRASSTAAAAPVESKQTADAKRAAIVAKIAATKAAQEAAGKSAAGEELEPVLAEAEPSSPPATGDDDKAAMEAKRAAIMASIAAAKAEKIAAEQGECAERKAQFAVNLRLEPPSTEPSTETPCHTPLCNPCHICRAHS